MKVITILTAVAGCVAFALSPRGKTTDGGGNGGAETAEVNPPTRGGRAPGFGADPVRANLNVDISRGAGSAEPKLDVPGAPGRQVHPPEKRNAAPGEKGYAEGLTIKGGTTFTGGYGNIAGNSSRAGKGGGAGGSGGLGDAGEKSSASKASDQADGPETNALADTPAADVPDDSTPETLPMDDPDISPVAIVPVPEPSTVLFGLALTAAVGFARRRPSAPAA